MPRKVSCEDIAESWGLDIEDVKAAIDHPSKKYSRRCGPKRPNKQPRRKQDQKPKKLEMPQFGEPFDLDSVVFTDHALKRFVERHNTVNLEEDPREAALKILSKTSEKDGLSAVDKVKRLINNAFVEVRYFVGEGLRFVIKEGDDMLTVLTIERVNS